MTSIQLPNTTVDDVPNELRFSASRLGAYDRCSLKHHYIYRNGFRAPFNASYLTLGIIIHRLLALHYGEGLTPAEAWPMIKDEFPTYEEQLLSYTAIVLVGRYIHKFKKDDAEIQVLGVEKELIVPFLTPNGVTVYLHGIIDLLYAFNDEVEVMDHKSSARKVWNVDSVYFDAQVGMYLVILMLLGLQPKRGLINQISTASKDTKKIMKASPDDLFQRFPITPSSVVIETWAREIGEKIDRILEEETHPPTRSNQCTSCGFYEACKMQMNNQDPTPWLNKTFVYPKHFEVLVDLDLDELLAEEGG